MSHAARGPKPKPRALPNLPLSPEAPKELKGRARALYVKLAGDLSVEGYSCQADSRLVSLTATTEAHAERLAAEVAGLGSLTLETDKGGVRLHPLVTELRAVRRELSSLYGQLFMSPRSRSSSRLSEQQRRDAVARNLGGVGPRNRSKARFFAADEFDEFLDERRGGRPEGA